ncbi:MAG: hypothetical protein ABIC40_07015, partial [bacterium]
TIDPVSGNIIWRGGSWFRCISRDGTKIWAFNNGNQPWAPIIDGSGDIYALGDWGYIEPPDKLYYRLRKYDGDDGSLLWESDKIIRTANYGSFSGALALGEDGTVYFTGEINKDILYAFGY